MREDFNSIFRAQARTKNPLNAHPAALWAVVVVVVVYHSFFPFLILGNYDPHLPSVELLLPLFGNRLKNLVIRARCQYWFFYVSKNTTIKDERRQIKVGREEKKKLLWKSRQDFFSARKHVLLCVQNGGRKIGQKAHRNIIHKRRAAGKHIQNRKYYYVINTFCNRGNRRGKSIWPCSVLMDPKDRL